MAGTAAVAVCGLAVLVALLAGEWQAAGVLAGISLVGVGLVLALWGRRHGRHDRRQHREQRGPSMQRRRVLMRLGALGAGLAGVGLVVPAALRVGQATARLRDTGWSDGVALVDAEGRRIRADRVEAGTLYTVYPEGRVGESLSQALLVGVEQERVRLPDEQGAWAPEGLLAYSKLCTHMACPVGLYQDREGTVECPCHQAVFDLLVGGEVLRGPARRPLPQLPIAVRDDGYLISTADFASYVGTGFWEAP